MSINSFFVRAKPASPGRTHSPFHNFLYRSLGLPVILALSASVVAGQAQEQAPEIAPREKKVKKDKEPRAVGLMQLSPSGKATLIPIAIMIDHKFYDASAYKATPVPMALESGTVYEAERTGESLGLFTVSGAQHSLSERTVSPWIGTGTWLPSGTSAPKTTRQAETAPVGIEAQDERPRLTKSDNTPKDAPPPAPPPAGSQAPSGSSGSNPPSASQPASGTAAPTPAKPPGASDQSGTPPASPTKQEPDDPNVPRLRRAKPPKTPTSDEDLPGYGKPGLTGGGVAKDAGGAGAKTPEPSAAKTSVQLVPAISDAGGPEPRSYRFEWTSGEEEKRRKQMLDLAADEFRTYLRKQEQGMIAAQTAPKQTATARKPAPKPQQPVFENVQFRAYDVWNNNEPVMIVSADAHMPLKPGAAEPPGSYMVTLAARTDIYGNLRKLYSGVTDKFHLDVSPQLELIDAVDADGDGRGELLFRETTDAGIGYVIYKPTADVLWKVFDSFNPD